MFDQTSGAYASTRYPVRSLVLGRLRLRLSTVSVVLRVESRPVATDRVAEAMHQRPPSHDGARSVVDRALMGEAWRIR